MREFSVPASFTVGEHDNVVSSVFSHERDDPDHVIFQRLVDGAWTDVTCKQAADQIRSAALGLIAEGVKPGDRVAILSATRYEWPILDFAILAAGAVTVPIYETSSAEQVRFVLHDSGAVLVFAETDEHADKIEQLEHELPELRKVLRIDGSGTPALDALAEAGKSVDPKELEDRLAGHHLRRPGDADLHLGHHRTAQGLPADPLQPAVRDPRRQGVLPDAAGQGRADAGVPAAGARARPCHHHGVLHQQGHARLHQRHQEPGADLRRVQADAGGVGAAGVREGLQHRRAERPQRRQGPDLRAGGRHRDRVQPGAGLRRCRPAAAGQARGVRPAGLRQAARRARRQLPRRDLRRRAAGCPARPLLPRRRPDHLRGLRADRDQRGDHREPGRRT